MNPRDLEEYRALRETIRERGTARPWMFLFSLVGWGALTIATSALAALPVATLLPLLVLAGGFEALHALTIGVERVGRYLQVFHESAEPGPEIQGWEHAAMAFGRAFPGSAPDPVFSIYFAGAAVLNFVPVLLAEPSPIEVTVVGSAHLLFILRLLAARRAEGRQRALDLERFERIKGESSRSTGR